MAAPLPRLQPIMLLGPTASGKSAVAAALAEAFPLEIISIDSAQVYRGLDIGTAKPDRSERARIVHHLIDIIEPEESYSAARFAREAGDLIDAVIARGRLPLLVGGTMLYAKALRTGLHDLPQADPTIRRQLDHEASRLGWPALHSRLAAIDASTASRLAPGDAQRIQRALEVWMLTGRPLSAWLAEGSGSPTSRRSILRIALEPSERSVLHTRIENRFRSMIEAGLVEEVRALRRRPGLHAAMPSMRSVGYRQVWEWLDQPTDTQALVARATAATRQLAKRQLTWLRSDDERVVIDCLAPDLALRVRTHVARALGG
jgi:tRNA dimethylallyltransferase